MIKKILLLIMICCGLLPGFAADATDEIVIEMTGTPDKKTPGQNIWDKNAVQLMKLFRKKNKDEVIKTVADISAQEQILTAKNGTPYVLIQYGKDTEDYRKFLFRQEMPQSLVACAAEAKDIVTVFQRYGINIGLRQGDFLQAFLQLDPPTELMTADSSLTVYKLPPEQLPLAAKEPLILVFDQTRLVQLFNSAAEFETYQKTLPPLPTPAEPKAPAKPAPQQRPKVIYKGLVSGGTLHDRMYLPRITGGSLTPTPNPNTSNSK